MTRTLWTIVFLVHIGCAKITTLPAVRLSIRFFNNCEEVKSYVKDTNDRYERALSHRSGPRVQMANDTAGESYVNLQEQDVDEPDQVRVGRTLLYFAHPGRIEVVDRATRQHLGSIPGDPTRTYSLFTDEETLISLGSGNTDLEVRVFRSTAAKKFPELISTRKVEGSLKEARYLQGRIVLLFNGWLNLEGSQIPISADGSSIAGVGCNAISVPFVNDRDFSYSKLVTLNPHDLEGSEKSLIVLGMSDHLYMTSKSIYLVKSHLYWPTTHDSWNRSVVSKIDLDTTNGGISLDSVGEVAGYVYGRWALKEYPESSALAVVTTTSEEDGATANALWVLRDDKDKLLLSGSVEGFGPRENVRAVRYVDKMAYVVTFEKTDPLFAIDMSNPLTPQLKGELEVPGFSVYLHPSSPGRLLGLGFDAFDRGGFSWFGGLQFSLFDVADPTKLTRMDNHIFGARGSYSEATSDPHAFFFESAQALAGFPLVELEGGDTSQGVYGNRVKFSGAVLYRVGSTLQEVARISHSRWVPSQCEPLILSPSFWSNHAGMIDISRLLRVDGRLLAFSRFGMTTHDLADPKSETAQLSFPTVPTSELCPNKNRYAW